MQFLNPLLLWGLAAASIPIVIHLLNRRRFRVQRWAAMEWLLAAVRQNQRRLRIENLLLLLCRTFAVLFLAMAIARPFLTDSLLAMTTQHAHLYVLLDNSASMAARTGARSAFDDALSQTASLLGEVGTDDPVTLVLTNDNAVGDTALGGRTGRPRVVLNGTRDHGKVRRLLGDLRPAAARADLVDAMKVLEEAVPGRGGVTSKVAVITDLQQIAVAGGAARDGTTPEESLRGTLQRLKDKGAEVVLIEAGRFAENVAITALRLAEEDRDVVQGATVAFEAEVRNFGERTERVEVRFLVDGEVRGGSGQWVTLPPRPAGAGSPAAVAVEFSVRFAEGEVGTHVLEASIPTDALPVDDRRALAFDVRPALRVLAVDGDPAPTDPDAVPETWWLAPTLGLTESGPVSVKQVPEAEYHRMSSFADHDLVILANVAHPARDDAARERLDAWLRRGGALFLTVGDHVVPEVWNQELYHPDRRILPARLGEPVFASAEDLPADRPAGWPLYLAENRHPMMAAITNPAAVGFFTPPILRGRMSLVDLVAEKDSRVVLTYDASGYPPALVERRVGRGRVLLLTTTVDEDWGRLPGSNLFPVLLHEAAYYLTARGNADRNLLTYQPYVRALPENVAGVEVTLPDGSPGRAEVETPPDAAPYLTVVDTSQPGVYRTTVAFKPADILSPAPAPRAEAFAVNLTPLESDLRRLRREEAVNRWPGLIRVGDGFGSAAEAVRVKGGDISPHLLIAALACLVGETLLVRRIARTRTRAA